MQARYAWTGRIVTRDREAERAHGIMALQYGIRAFRRGGRGLVNNQDRPTFQTRHNQSTVELKHRGNKGDGQSGKQD
jgi:hypothetical protein